MFIPLSVPNIVGNEKEYINKALDDGWVSTAGSFVNQFESDISQYVGAKNAVACQSGTSGLHLALRYAGVKRDELVIAPTLTFIAAVNGIRYLGADPVFMDCDDSLCIDPVKLENFCKQECILKDNVLVHKGTNKPIRAVIVVHVFGNICDMESLIKISKKYNICLIEDATEALGTYYTKGKLKGKFAGTVGNIGVYSFNGNKIITTGGGGMVVTNDDDAAKKIQYWSTQAKDDTVNFIHNDIGYNYRMTNIQAAMGVAQLECLENFIKVKEENYNLYKVLLNSIEGIDLLPFKSDIRANYWFYSLFLRDEALQAHRDEIIKRLDVANIQTRPIWGLIHEQKPYKDSLCYNIDFAYSYQRGVINLPCSSSLTAENVHYVCDSLKSILKDFKFL